MTSPVQIQENLADSGNSWQRATAFVNAVKGVGEGMP